MNIHLIIIHSGENVGDKNQSLGIATALATEQSSGVVTREECSAKDQSIDALNAKIAAVLHEGKQLILISAGSSGLSVLHALKQAFPDVKSIWSGHQVFAEVGLFESAAAPDVMAFPKHQQSYIPEYLKAKTQLVLTDGVPHNLSASTIEADRAAFMSKRRTLPEFMKKTAVVILPGDAPDMRGMEKIFTPENALALAERVHRLYPEYAFAVTNSPRTGKYLDPINAHRAGGIDPVTEAFVKRLAELSGCTPALYDFQFASLPSAYKPLLYAVKTSAGSILLCPGESTSMVTETLGYLPREKVVIMEVPEVMSEAHHEHLTEVSRMGGVQILESAGTVGQSTAIVTEPSTELAASQIAKRFIAPGSSTSFLFKSSAASLEDYEPDNREWSRE
ncbi:MAG: ELM1/GtrOC1 family putative glycosyltransferase [Gammaproteobacteria bacterium]|nr:ELM1/GtrOC1 family putative glycosyltransferase [Gammaproteobacteria bacterium]